MTDRAASGTSGGLAGTSGGRRDALFLLMVMAIGAAVAIVGALTVIDDRARMGRPIPLWEPVVWETTSVAMLVLLTPGLLAATRRWPPLRRPWRVVAPVHLTAAVVFSLLHVLGMGVLRWAIYQAVGGDYGAFDPLGRFAYEFRKDVLIYVAIVGAYVLWLRLTEPRPQLGGGPSTLEVRDGARRFFLPLADILWVEAAGNYVELHRADGSVLHRAPLAQMERQLAPAGFVRIHRSRLVRRSAVVRADSRPSGDFTVQLADGRELAGSRRYRRPLLEAHPALDPPARRD